MLEDITPSPDLEALTANYPILSVYLPPFFSAFIYLWLSGQAIRWFCFTMNSLQCVYMYLFPHCLWLRRLTRRVLKQNLNDTRHSPFYGVDTFCFLLYDIESVGDDARRKLCAILSAAERERIVDAEDAQEVPWWDYLPWRIVQAMKPRTILRLSRRLSTTEPVSIIYGEETWFESPPPEENLPLLLDKKILALISQPVSSSQRTDAMNEVTSNLNALRHDLAQQIHAARRPRQFTPSQFAKCIEWAWTSNPYLVDFQKRYKVPNWGVPVPIGLFAADADTRSRIFRPHNPDPRGNSVRISVDPEAGAARIELDEDSPSFVRNLEGTVNEFRVLHVELLTSFKELFKPDENPFTEATRYSHPREEQRKAPQTLEDIVQEAFRRVAKSTGEKMDSERNILDHWRALKAWRPKSFDERDRFSPLPPLTERVF
ncbi:hypothetical protein CkaCkLH20_06671 [Colletotrichum karsti]|uniref:Uncharacterized protein n=1 Tax=Colletotrichum karsti TaxID=1095194 RepID=A0A9P6I486_9PEZI|nr:uncharacterized protein CkaCkLH20_06671 [Colletotrichum karsti]KAF9875739.1 hypothetical protein CkaCkLH20_06671 [Colletotrichum karsti]